MTPENEKPLTDSRTNLFFLIVLRIVDTIKYAIKVSGYCFCAYIIFLCISALSGKDTRVEVLLDFFDHSDWNDIKWVLIGILLFIAYLYAFIANNSKESNIESMGKHNQNLEKIIDKNRTSSGIAPNGDTHPNDRDGQND